MMSLVKVFIIGMLLAVASARPDDTRIIGGSEAKEDRYPYHVSLWDSGSGHFCGGSLILKDVVLTAAHCLGGSFSVLIGRHDFDDKDGEFIQAKTQIPHPNYDADTSENDVAVVILKEPVQNAVPLVTLNDDDSYPTPGEMAQVMGWGNMKTNGFDLPDVPMMVNVEVISNQDCEKMEQDGESYAEYGFDIFDDMICTYTDNKDACQGDSGGPLIISGDDVSQDVQIGVVSWGVGCAYLPGVYSRISHAYEWIQETACDKSTDTTGSTLCGTPEPTNEPTKKPTPQPTNEPTEKPSFSPSSSPTVSPSSSPSISPSAVPSLSSQPSEMPSSSPSFVPSAVPSELPSEIPSLSPSQRPSSKPSTSTAPSNSPTISSQPSPQPSDAPSDFPSMSPTFYPTNSPTVSTAPTHSSAPSEENDRLIPADSLMINAMELVNGDGKIETNASSGFGSSSSACFLGSLLSFLISAWLYY